MNDLRNNHIDAMLRFQQEATLADFNRIFGDLGLHQWQKFNRLGNLLLLWWNLDDYNRALLVHYLNGGN